jgi:hypothetical protein
MQWSAGSLVRARGRDWVALPATLPGLVRLKPLTGPDHQEIGLFLPLENRWSRLPSRAPTGARSLMPRRRASCSMRRGSACARVRHRSAPSGTSRSPPAVPVRATDPGDAMDQDRCLVRPGADELDQACDVLGGREDVAIRRLADIVDLAPMVAMAGDPRGGRRLLVRRDQRDQMAHAQGLHVPRASRSDCTRRWTTWRWRPAPYLRAKWTKQDIGSIAKTKLQSDSDKRQASCSGAGCGCRSDTGHPN